MLWSHARRGVSLLRISGIVTQSVSIAPYCPVGWFDMWRRGRSSDSFRSAVAFSRGQWRMITDFVWNLQQRVLFRDFTGFPLSTMWPRRCKDTYNLEIYETLTDKKVSKAGVMVSFSRGRM